MSSARVEELSDSDPEEVGSDPEEMDIEEFNPAPTTTTLGRPAPPNSNSSLLDPSAIPPGPQQPPRQVYDKERVKNWQCLYPLYFDASRTRSEGRRVGKQLAVSNPLARDIVEAVGRMGLQVAFEPGKTHPKDWANPGRVRVLVKEDGEVVKGKGVDSKHHLYLKVAEYLKANPTTTQSPLSLRIPGMPHPSEPPPPPAVPRGWKLGSVLPLHSPALTGGGVSENLFKDMMAEMGGASPGEIGQGGSGGEKKEKKKDKKKVKG